MKVNFREAPIRSGLASVGVSIMGLGVGATLVVWGVFLAILRALFYPFRKK